MRRYRHTFRVNASLAGCRREQNRPRIGQIGRVQTDKTKQNLAVSAQSAQSVVYRLALPDKLLDAVADFHNSSAALRQLSPPPMIVQFQRIEPMGEDAVADFTMWFGPVPIRWTAVHSNVNPPHGFTDTQVHGPFRTWVHRHTFRAIDGETTEVVDEIEAEPDSLISRLMWLNMPILFAFRGWKTRRVLARKSPAISKPT